MKNLIRQLKISLLATAVLLVLVSGVYPLVVWGISQAVFRNQAEGSLIRKDGKVIGSELLGQNFASERYFHPRPSAAGSGYDAGASSGSNLGPTSQKLMDSVKARVERYRQVNGVPQGVLIPPDAVTTSASGLDPEISPANARLQAARVAKVRGLDAVKVESLIRDHTRGRSMGILGDPGVNVLKLNLALDELK